MTAGREWALRMAALEEERGPLIHGGASGGHPRPWTCTKCGACCRSLGSGLLALSPEVAALDSGDGVCRHLDRSTNLCTIYETRPAGCRVTEAHNPAALREGCAAVHLRVYGQPWEGAPMALELKLKNVRSRPWIIAPLGPTKETLP